jgi:hypothetical protein
MGGCGRAPRDEWGRWSASASIRWGHRATRATILRGLLVAAYVVGVTSITDDNIECSID